MATPPGHAEGVAALRNAGFTPHVLAALHIHVCAVHGEECGVLHVAVLGLVEPQVAVRLGAQVPAIKIMACIGTRLLGWIHLHPGAGEPRRGGGEWQDFQLQNCTYHVTNPKQ